mmetsp:Transcript_9233/g.13087  ORF Transcript_9233/g.13087 Transcript_9233/m.13087 type:complete len:81 (+) Transcript_9233:127-369(+)
MDVTAASAPFGNKVEPPKNDVIATPAVFCNADRRPRRGSLVDSASRSLMLAIAIRAVVITCREDTIENIRVELCFCFSKE